VKTVPEMTYNVFSGTLNPTHSPFMRYGTHLTLATLGQLVRHVPLLTKQLVPVKGGNAVTRGQ